jgi:hypothetical protein
MYVGKVIGTVVSTVKVSHLEAPGVTYARTRATPRSAASEAAPSQPSRTVSVRVRWERRTTAVRSSLTGRRRSLHVERRSVTANH